MYGVFCVPVRVWARVCGDRRKSVCEKWQSQSGSQSDLCDQYSNLTTLLRINFSLNQSFHFVTVWWKCSNKNSNDQLLLQYHDINVFSKEMSLTQKSGQMQQRQHHLPPSPPPNPFSLTLMSQTMPSDSRAQKKKQSWLLKHHDSGCNQLQWPSCI